MVPFTPLALRPVERLETTCFNGENGKNIMQNHVDIIARIYQVVELSHRGGDVLIQLLPQIVDRRQSAISGDSVVLLRYRDDVVVDGSHDECVRKDDLVRFHRRPSRLESTRAFLLPDDLGLDSQCDC